MKIHKFILISNKLVSFLLITFIIIGCSKKNKELVSKKEITSFLIEHVGNIEIENVRNIIADSVLKWKEINVEGYKSFPNSESKFDSLICFNKSKTKIFTIRYGTSLSETSYDGYSYFYGVKIKESWYFFDGEYQPVARNDPKIPATFVQLRKIAFEDVFQYYLYRNERGDLEINERIFSSLTDGGWAEGNEGIMPKSKEEWDQRYLREAEKRRAKIDTNNYN